MLFIHTKILPYFLLIAGIAGLILGDNTEDETILFLLCAIVGAVWTYRKHAVKAPDTEPQTGEKQGH